MTYELIHANAIEWLTNNRSKYENYFHAVITDPPYGLKEYKPEELEKRANGSGGIWRIPPKIGGSERSPLPRFTVLEDKDIEELYNFLFQTAKALFPVLRPGGHIFIATNSILEHIVSNAFIQNGFEKRAIIVRLVQTLRGGDRPKNAESEFPEVCVMPRSAWEPWVLFRKPLEGRVSDNLRKWETGGLRRISMDVPFMDVIPSERTSKQEREIAPHPSLKPQSFLRQLIWAALPLGKGVILDPFAGSGSTLAAATALNVRSLGIEVNSEYYEMAKKAIPQLALVKITLPVGSVTTSRNGRKKDGIAKCNTTTSSQSSIFDTPIELKSKQAHDK
mgnify:CR=1 FL=1